MKNVAITSPFRDGAEYIDGYRAQFEALEYQPDHLRLYAVEGDSKDDTLSRLDRWADEDTRIEVIRFDTGRPKFPSAVDVARFRHLAEIFNVCLESALKDDWADYVCFIPSDVMFGPGLIASLLAHDRDIISPMYWRGDHPNGARFYDIWGYKHLDGREFPPASFAWYSTRAEFLRGPVPLLTTGGVMLTRRDVLDAGVRYQPDNVDHGLCEMAIEKGFTIWCDPNTHVVHR